MNMNVTVSNDSLTAELIRIWIDVGNALYLGLNIIAWAAIIACAVFLYKWVFKEYKKFKSGDSSSVLRMLLKRFYPNKTNMPQ